MDTLNNKLNRLRERTTTERTKIMIMGLGSVGNYLLDYLMSLGNEKIEICVVGRNYDKMLSDVNIIKVASMIRGQNRSEVHIIGGIDFNNITSLTDCIRKWTPDIIVNSSRAYSGLKYGSISWTNIRAYGIWAPLAIKYIRNIMEAYELAESSAIVINTSYSDAVIAWLKSAGKAYPDFGSGNINHLIPRIKFAVAQEYGIKDSWNIDITFATSHFHDVVISKEGQTENVNQLIDIRYQNNKLTPDMNKIFSMCKIAMPVDAKRNMMNASSNFEIIQGILAVTHENTKCKLHSPGVFGEVGGYPVILNSSNGNIIAAIDESRFNIDVMREKNRESIYLDGIRNIDNGTLYYTDELISKVKHAFDVALPCEVDFNAIDDVAQFLISDIIAKNI